MKPTLPLIFAAGIGVGLWVSTHVKRSELVSMIALQVVIVAGLGLLVWAVWRGKR